MSGGEVIVTKNGKEVGRFIPKSETVSFLTDALSGILPNIDKTEDEREKVLKKKYEIMD